MYFCFRFDKIDSRVLNYSTPNPDAVSTVSVFLTFLDSFQLPPPTPTPDRWFNHCLIAWYLITYETICIPLTIKKHKFSISNSSRCHFAIISFNASIFFQIQSEKYKPETSLDKPSCWIWNENCFVLLWENFCFEHSAQLMTH